MADLGLNFKTLVTINLIFILILSVQSAPTDLEPEIEAPKNCSNGTGLEENNEEPDLIDQGQDGVANVRVSIKDVALIWTPLNSLLAASALLDPQILGEEFLGEEFEKPENGPNQEQHPLIVDLLGSKPQNFSLVKPPEKENENVTVLQPTAKPVVLNRSNVRLPILLGPFLKRRQ